MKSIVAVETTPEIRLDSLLQTLGETKQLLILPHNNPDPDAIACALALHHLVTRKLGIEVEIVYQGIIGRAENKALVRYLGHPLRRLHKADLAADKAFALVDTQPQTGNNPLPLMIKPVLVLDHHPWREESATAAYFDVRPDLGAASTMITQYLLAAGLPPPPKLATALFYGIKTDTLSLCRGTTPEDADVFCYLQSELDFEALLKIERAQIPATYFRGFAAALQEARVYRHVVISYIGVLNYPDQAAEMADLLLRIQGVRWVICLGIYKDSLMISIRTYNKQGAGQLAQHLVHGHGSAGGHGALAGGRVPLKGVNPDRLAQILTERALTRLQIPAGTVGKPLV